MHHFVTEFVKNRESYSRLCLKNSLRTRIKTVKREVFEKMKNCKNNTYIQHCQNEYIFTHENGCLYDNEGILLSCISKYTEDNIGVTMNYNFIKKLNSSYGEGHDRKRCEKIGLATYRVERGTKRPHPRPMVREEDIGKHQYFNEKINQSQLTQYQIEMKANTLSEKAVDFGKSENKPIFDVISDSCDMTILTSGITHQTEIPHFEKKTIQ